MHDYLIGANYILILGATLIALNYLSNINKLAVYIFGLLAALFGLIGEYIPDSLGYFYYIGAGLTDLLVIYILSRIAHPTKLISKIQELCICFIAVNFAGWVMFMAYMEPIYYTALCFLLYSRMIIITKGDGNALGDNTMGGWYPRIFSSDNTGTYSLQPNKKETRN